MTYLNYLERVLQNKYLKKISFYFVGNVSMIQYFWIAIVCNLDKNVMLLEPNQYTYCYNFKIHVRFIMIPQS